MSHHWGYIAVLLSAFLFGIGTTINKILLETMSPLFIAAVTYFVAGILLASSNLLARNAKSISWLKLPPRAKSEFVRRDILLIISIAVVGGVLAPYLYLLGLNNTTAVSAALLGNTESLFTLLIAIILFGERGTLKDYAAMAILIIGAVTLTTNLSFNETGAFGSLVGNLLVVTGCLFWGIDNNLSRLLTVKRNLLQVGSLKGIIGGGLMLGVASLYGLRVIPSTFSIALVVVVGFFSVGLSLLLFLFSLQEIGAMRTGVIFSTSSLFGAVSAFLILREPISAIQLLAGLLMLSAIYLLSMPAKNRSGQA